MVLLNIHEEIMQGQEAPTDVMGRKEGRNKEGRDGRMEMRRLPRRKSEIRISNERVFGLRNG